MHRDLSQLYKMMLSSKWKSIFTFLGAICLIYCTGLYFSWKEAEARGGDTMIGRFREFVSEYKSSGENSPAYMSHYKSIPSQKTETGRLTPDIKEDYVFYVERDKQNYPSHAKEEAQKQESGSGTSTSLTIYTSRNSVKAKPSNRRYLVLVHFDDNGPNVQYHAFKEGVTFAIQNNRSIVEPYFWAQALTQEDHISSQHFLHETFDIGKISEIVHIATKEEFNQDCKNRLECLLLDPLKSYDGDHNYLMPKMYERQKKHFREVYQISLPDFDDLPKTASERRKALEISTSLKCVGLYRPSFWQWRDLQDRETRMDCERNVVVNSHLQKLAQEISEKLCDGKPYASWHWRNRTGEKCAPPYQCKGQTVEVMANLNKTAEVGAMDIRNLMKKNNLSCIYVAIPPYAQLMLKIMEDAKVPNVVSKHVITPPKYPDVEKYKHDNYFWSLLEQEICIRSEIHIASSHSSWDHNVQSARKFNNAQTLLIKNILSWVADENLFTVL